MTPLSSVKSRQKGGSVTPEGARELARDVDDARQEYSKATAAALDPISWHIRDEWMQLQVLRRFMPGCFVCGRSVGPVHVVLGRSVRELCLDCVDAWSDQNVEAPVEDTPVS